MKIVRITKENAELLNNIAEDVFDHEIIPESLGRFLDCPRHVLFVAIDEEVVVGMASGVEYFHPDKKPQMFINEVGVTPNQQRQGIGSALSAALIDEAESRGCTYAWLGTEPDNLPANKCYQKLPNGDPSEEFVLYGWDIGNWK
ncbi:MAG: GNAT family N-acetyltransferase [Pyrinomonadaceae bacterium]